MELTHANVLKRTMKNLEKNQKKRGACSYCYTAMKNSEAEYRQLAFCPNRTCAKVWKRENGQWVEISKGGDNND